VHFGESKSVQTTSNDLGVQSLASIDTQRVPRYITGLADMVWGNEDDPGLATVSVTILGGAPGFGKTTFCLQLLSQLAKVTGRPGLYVAAEESGVQIKGKAFQLGISNLDDVLVLSLEKLSQGYQLNQAVMNRYNPCAVVVDSQQAFSGNDEMAALAIAKGCKEVAGIRQCPHVIIGQMTKEEDLAGSNKILHQVDTLLIGTCLDEIEIDGELYVPPVLPGGRIEPFRMLAAKSKNRFGVLNEMFFTMTGRGLVPFSPKLPAKKERKSHG
jgi:predicted ATP-dependent serine protease